MNRIYRLVWNRTLGVLQVVAETATGRGSGAAPGRSGAVGSVAGTRPPLRRLAACVAAALAGPMAATAWALPTGGMATSGAVVINSPSPTTLQIDQGSPAASINWSGFSVGTAETVTVSQLASTSGAVFSVTGTPASSLIDGMLNSTGNVVLSNPYGTTFGTSASVNMGGLLGTSLAPTSYSGDGSGITSVELALPTALVRSAVLNHGSLQAAQQGAVALVGTSAYNAGIIRANGGRISLVAADSVSANLRDGSIAVTGAIQGGLRAIAVSNTGTLIADGGTIVLEGQAAPSVSGPTLVSTTGVLQAKGGSVRLTAMGGGLVANGTIDVSPVVSGGPGGNVSIRTDGQASVGATIKADGGSVSIDAAAIDLSGTVTADAVQLHATDAKGAVSQFGGALTTGSLSIDAVGHVVLGSASNAIASLGTSTVGGSLVLTTSAGLTQTGALAVAGTSSFSTSGTLSLGDAKNSFGGAVSIAAGGDATLRSSGGMTVSSVTAGSKSAIELAAGNWLAVGDLSAGAATLTAGTNMMLSGTLAANRMSLGSGGTISQTSGMLTAGTLDVNASGNVALSSAGNFIGSLGASTVGGNLALATSTGLSQTGPLVVAGTSDFMSVGSLALTDARNSFGGAVRANALGGGVALRSSGDLNVASLGAAGAVSLVAGGTLTLPGTAIDTGGNDLTLASNGGALSVSQALRGNNISLAASGGMVVTAAVTAAQQLSLDPGANQIALVNGNLQASTTRIDSGTVQVGQAGGSSGSISGDIINNGTLHYMRAGNAVVGGAIGGSGRLVYGGGGRLELTAANSYTGLTQVTAGTLALTGAGSIASSSGVSLAAGAAFDVSGSKAGQVDIGALAGASGSAVQLGAKALSVGGANTTSTFGGTIAGTGGSLVKTGSGTLTLAGTSTYSGGTELKQGRIDVGNGNALGIGALAMDDGTTLGFAANGLTLANDIRMTGTNDPVIDTGSFDATLAGAIGGGGFLTKNGSGTLTLTSSANDYTGATHVAAGTLRAGAANTFSAGSVHSVASGATLDLAGFSQRIAGLDNSGTVSLTGSTPGTTLTVTGAYVGNNGVLRLGTALGSSASVSDRLVLSGPAASASGQTILQITHLGGLGALTTGNGIEIVSAENGATTTAQTTKNAFALAGGHVDAGAYEYRLRAGDASGAGENWYLRSHTDAPVTPTEPGTPTTPTTPTSPAEPSEAPQPQAPAVAPTPTYRAEVPLLAALPAQLRQADLAMLGNLHQRIGDDDPRDVSAGARRRAWARLLSSDIDIRQGGVANAQSDGRLSGLQAGTDLLALAHWRAGVYVGQLDGNVSVNGFASGVQNLAVGSNDVRNQYLGVYGTYTGAGGFYADAVLQGARQRIEAAPATNARSDGKGHSLLASIELGQSFAVGGNWTVEPQLQLVHRSLSLDDMIISGALVQQDSESDWVGRAGVRIRGAIGTGAGLLQPYARVNAYRASSGTDVVRFIGPAGSADIATPTGHTTWELAAGATLALSPAVDLYGEMGQLHASGGGNEEVRSSVQGSVGLRVRW